MNNEIVKFLFLTVFRCIAISSLLILTACAGIITSKQGTYYYSNFDIYTGKGTLNTHTARNKAPITKEKVIQYWGQPNKVDIDIGGCEVWRYRQGFGFSGVIPVIGSILPIPLGIPNNHYTYLYFQDDKAVLAGYEDGQTKFYGCSIITPNDKLCTAFPTKEPPSIKPKCSPSKQF